MASGKTGNAGESPLSVKDAVRLLGMPEGPDSPRTIRRLIVEGRVPFVERCGPRWILCKASVAFLKKWFGDSRRKTGMPGHVAAEEMAKAAAAADESCKERQLAKSQSAKSQAARR